jgi:hypothetical protein
MAGYRLRGFTFTPTEYGGLVIDATAHSLHLSDDELFEMLAVCGLSADSVEAEPLLDLDEAKLETEEEE